MPRPSSSAGSTSGARPYSAVLAAHQLAGASMNYQSFCAALVHVASHVARSTPQLLDANPFLSVGAGARLAALAGNAAVVDTAPKPVGLASHY